MDHEQLPQNTIAFEPPTANVIASTHPEVYEAPVMEEAPTHQDVMIFETPETEPTVVPKPVRKKRTAWHYVWYVTKFLLRMALGLLLAVLVLGVGLLGYLTVTEYTPAYAEAADRGSFNCTEKITDKSLRIVCFNTGYAALGEDADFFQDGGESVQSSNEKTVSNNMRDIERFLSDSDADFIFLQEVDTDSKCSYETKQWLSYEHGLEDYESRFALNHSCAYVPYPLFDHIGKVHSGLATYSRYDITSATRYSLPNSYAWPERVANPKRCLLVTRIPIEGSEQELVLVNLHFEAYDDDESMREQTKQLMELLETEYEKGNYVLAGGNFNQSFPNCDTYPIVNDEYFVPEELSSLRNGWQYAYDDSVPTARLLNEPYNPRSKNTQYYVIDGFIVSPNVTVERVETVDEGFEYSNHNPIVLEFVLQ